MPRLTFYEDQNYNFDYELLDGLDGEQIFHIHADVRSFSSSVLKSMYINYAKLKEYSEDLGFDRMYSVSPNPKFCELFGGESLGSYGNNEVMVWQQQQ